jgi:hypothetical protein
MTRQTTLIHNQREIILYDLSKKYKIKHFSTSYLLNCIYVCYLYICRVTVICQWKHPTQAGLIITDTLKPCYNMLKDRHRKWYLYIHNPKMWYNLVSDIDSRELQCLLQKIIVFGIELSNTTVSDERDLLNYFCGKS